MVNHSSVEDAVKSNLPFDVVAVAQNNISQILDTGTGTTAPRPVNIKIRVRNKEEITGEYEIVSVPKLSTSGPKSVRLVSSDQTIVSFDLFMETEKVKNVSKKSHYKFLNLFKPTGCFNNQNDDDVYPYVPSSSNETNRTMSASNINDIKDDKIIKKKIALTKNLSSLMSTDTTLKTPTFLGRCKPGGCLDPPFNEDKYIYKPNIKVLKFDQKNIEDIINTDESISPHTLSPRSIEGTYSHSLFTYPPALPSSGIRGQEETQIKKSKIRTSIENKLKVSVNEFSDTYFMPPRKQKNNENIDANFLKTDILRSDNSVSNIEKSLINQKESKPLSPNSTKTLFNRSPESKISYANVKDNSRNNANVNEVNVRGENLTVNEIKISRLANSVIDITHEGTENQVTETKADINVFGINQDNCSDTAPSFIYKDTLTNDRGPPITQYNQASKNECNSNETINQLNLMHKIPDESINNHSIVSQEENRLQSLIDNQALRSNLLNADENKMKFEHVVTSNKDILIDNLTETDNFRQMSLIESTNLFQNSSSDGVQLKESEYNKETLTIEDVITQDNQASKDEYNSNEIQNHLNFTSKILDEQINIYSIVSQEPNKLQSSVDNQALRSNSLNADENKIKFDHVVTSDKDILIDNLPETANLRQKSLIDSANLFQNSGPNGVQRKESEYNKKTLPMEDVPIITQDNQASIDEYNSNETQNQLNFTSKILDEQINNHSIASQEQIKLQTPVNNQALRSNSLNADENKVKFEHVVTSDKDILIDNLPEMDILQQDVSFVESANSFQNNGPLIQPNESENSQLSLKDIIYKNQKDLPQIRPSQDILSTTHIINEENSDINYLFAKADSGKLENKYNDGDITDLIPNNIEDKQITSHIQPILLSNKDLTEAISNEPNLNEKKTSMIAADFKIDSNSILGNIDKEIPSTTFHEKISSTLQIQKNEPLYYSNNLTDAAHLSTDYMEVHKPGDVIQSINSTVPVKMRSLENNDIDVRHNLSSKDIESANKETPESKPQLQLNNIILRRKLSDNAKSYSYNSRDTIDKNIDPAFLREPFKFTILKEYSKEIEETVINDNQNNLIKSEKEKALGNKNSSIEIDLGFQTIKSYKNQTIIKTFTSDDLKTDSQNKITIIKSIIRKNDGEIRIPVNSEMDLTLQIKKTLDKESISKRADVTKMESSDKATFNEDILLQETLASVYDNLVPVENIIRNLKQEADGLTQQQVLFREILNTLKTKSVRMIKTNNKCTCNEIRRD